MRYQQHIVWERRSEARKFGLFLESHDSVYRYTLHDTENSVFFAFRVFVADESGVRDNNKHKKQKQKKTAIS